MLSRLSARLSSCGGGAGSSSSAALQLWHGTPLRWAAAVRGLASTVRPPSVRDAQIRIFGWAQPEAGKRGETRHGHAPMKTLEKLKRRGLIAEKVRVPPRRRLLSLGSARLLTRTTPLPLFLPAPSAGPQLLPEARPQGHLQASSRPRGALPPPKHARARSPSLPPSLSCQVAPLPSPLCKVAAPTRALRAVAAQALNQEREEKLNLRKQLGKGPPKKGQGKRASKKK